MKQALGIEQTIKRRLAASERVSSEHYEQALVDYFRDLTISAEDEGEALV